MKIRICNIYPSTKKEKESVNIIIDKCINGNLNEANISIIACYLPLYKLLDRVPSLISFSSSNKRLNELIKLQILVFDKLTRLLYNAG